MIQEDADIRAGPLLRGEYERADIPEQAVSNPLTPLYAYNRLCRSGTLYSPVLDQNERESIRWPDGKSFAVCLTHDVDHVSAYSPRHSLRDLASHLSNQRGQDFVEYATTTLRKTAKPVRDSIKTTQNETDPLHCYERWLAIEDAVDARSTFFFMPADTNRSHYTDNDYTYSDTVVFDGEPMTVREMISTIHDRGWEIGLHPTWYAATDERELKYQKRQLELAVASEVVSARQHYLRYDIERTPSIHSEAGIEYDSSLGFNANVGFRFGTSYPWPLYDWQNQSRSNILEIPLIAQDVALFRRRKGMGLDPDTAVKYLKLLARRVMEVEGVLTLSWHPSYISNDGWVSVYERILHFLEEQGAWFATVGELGDWWKRNASLDVRY